MSIEEREALFLQMANHDQYSAGEIVDLDFQPFPEVSYLVVQCGGQQYRVSCRLSGMVYRLRPFTLNSYVGKDLDEFRPGWYAVVFFDEPLEEGETDILYPKEVFFSMPPAAENPQTIEDAIILTQYLSQALIKNFTHLPDKNIFTPDEALLRVADHLNLADLEMVEQPGGTPAYAAGDVGLYFTDIKYNRYFGMDRAEGAEIYQNQSFLDEAEFPDRIMDKPFIQYAVVVASGGHNDVYYVDINGTVTTTSYYSFDQDGNWIMS